MMPLVVMGILNVTPDSFAESAPLAHGDVADVDAAVARAMRLLDDGADIIDIGGESTRPGAEDVDEDIEQQRVLPVIERLRGTGAAISVDTRRASTAAAAIAAGARMVNDVSCGADPEMFPLIAEAGVEYVLMHNRGSSASMYEHARYADVAADVASDLRARIEAAEAAGVRPEQIIIDPGIGFAKLPEQNWQLLRNLDVVMGLGIRVLLGASRKRFIGELLGSPAQPRPVDQRDTATAMLSAWALQQGAWGVRVHDVRGTRDALAVAEALEG